MPIHVPADPVAAIYGFCAQSMHYPDTNWCTPLYLEKLCNLLDALGGAEEKADLQAACRPDGNYLEELQIEYTRLFINGIPRVAAPPYGSVYVDRSLHGRFSEDILAFYHAHGYRLQEAADLPDHIVHQLEFLSYLAEEGDQKGEEEFLRRFFLPWFHDFAERVHGEAHHPFYRIIVTIIDFFTKEEEEHGVQHNEA